MKAKLFLVFALVAIMGVMGACAKVQGAPPEVNVVVSNDEFLTNKHIVKEVEVAVDGTVTVTLASNPATGFSWPEIAQIGDAAVIQQTEHKYVAADGNLMGAPGNEVWTFQTLKKGTTTAGMQYNRPWAGGEKGEWSFQLTITVK
jgi:inhibitor of cysteine peptidase